MRKLLLSLGLLLGLAASAAAQVNVVPQLGVQTGYLPKQTFSAVFIGLVPAASTTDLVCISGSSSKKIQLLSMKLSGSGTAISLPVTVLRRASLDSGGTPATTTANPANTIGKRDLNNGAATATLISYTANPSINDSSPTYIDSQQLNISTTGGATSPMFIYFDWSKDIENLVQPPIIAAGSTTVQICMNLNATSWSSGLATGSISWTEE